MKRILKMWKKRTWEKLKFRPKKGAAQKISIEIMKKNNFPIQTFSISWFIAHNLAIEPILLVMVTSVAFAKSSLEILLRRSLLFI